MPDILTHATAVELAAAIEQNGVDCCLAWADWPRMELGRDDRMVWTLTDVSFPFFNNVFCAKLPPGEIESGIETATDRFRGRGVPAFWWTGPSTEPSGLGRHLTASARHTDT